jgi:hypothetical protein
MVPLRVTKGKKEYKVVNILFLQYQYIKNDRKKEKNDEQIVQISSSYGERIKKNGKKMGK